MKYDNISFTYDATGLRRSKSEGNTNTKYTWAGDRLLAEQRIMPTNDLYLPFYPSEDTYLNATSQEIEYIYGYNGVLGFKLNGTQYWYVKNMFGDVLQIIDEYTNIVAEYEYDAWGSCTTKADTDNIATLNPIRYRSYYYDTETGMYYLKSRYYDPNVGRFISMDSLDVLNTTATAINGLNLYAYCLNNPVMYTDSAGKYPVSIFQNGLQSAYRFGDKHNWFMGGHGTWKLITDPNIARIIGNITITVGTSTTTPNLGYAYGSIGIDSQFGVGFNLYDWFGIEAYVTTDLSTGFQLQITPLVHLGVNISLMDGIGVNFGWSIGNNTTDINITAGWGTMGLAVVGLYMGGPIGATLGWLFGKLLGI